MSTSSSNGFASVARVVGLVALFAFLIAGCASNPVVKPTPSASQTQVTDAEALAQFTTIVDASIAKQNQTGLTQTTVSSTNETYLLVADKDGGQYRPTEKNPDGSFQLLLEADAFVPAMAKAWLQLGATVSFDQGDYILTRLIEGTPTTYRFNVADGLLVSKSEQSVDGPSASILQYEITPDALLVLQAGEKISTN